LVGSKTTGRAKQSPARDAARAKKTMNVKLESLDGNQKNQEKQQAALESKAEKARKQVTGAQTRKFSRHGNRAGTSFGLHPAHTRPGA
jgi:hypothetical protein